MAKDKKNEVTSTEIAASAALADEMTQEVVVHVPTAKAVSPYAKGYGEAHAAEGVHLKAEEVLIPMLRIVQESSKIWKNRASDSTVKLGDIYDTVSGRVFDGQKGVLLVPIDCTACVIERKQAPDGTFIAKLKVNDPRVQTALAANGDDGWKQLKSKEKTQFNYTDEVLVALLNPDDELSVSSPAVVPFSGTNVFPRKKWWNKMAATPYAGEVPLYASRCILRTKERPNAAIKSFIFQVDPLGYTPGGNDDAFWSTCRIEPGQADDSLNRCHDFKSLFKTGTLGKTAYEDPDASENDLENAAFSGSKPAF
jgi:hypothetical protein